MTLLNEVIKRPLDAGYAEAAARKVAGQPQPGTPLRLIITITAVVLGLAVGTAVMALRAPAPEAVQARTALETKVAQLGQTVQELSTTGQVLAADVESLQSEVLKSADPAAARDATALAIAAGASAITGPGLEVKLIEDAAAITQGNNDARISAGDLHTIVNGLWQAGAEAISINDIRLTATSPISVAGQALLVDLVPVASPVQINAVGDGEVMEIKFARTPAGARVALLRNQYGAKISVTVADHLELPAAGRIANLYYAKPAELIPSGGVSK
jgi:uncharacterized protein YlxW (UPF0749 family)